LIADSSHDKLVSILADDVVWIEVDQRSQPHAPSIYRGREAVIAMLEMSARAVHRQPGRRRHRDRRPRRPRRDLHVPRRQRTGALHALLHVRDGKIVRWDGVQAWDE